MCKLYSWITLEENSLGKECEISRLLFLYKLEHKDGFSNLH